ncbi:MAG: hypothetical protein HKO08_08925 [Erythrobacter sp.]|nr:hypothetical protein [Erythrobacter sp.]
MTLQNCTKTLAAVGALWCSSAVLFPAAAFAESETFVDVSTRGVAAKRDVVENDEFDSTGYGADLRLLHEKEGEKLRYWVDTSVGIFDYIDEGRTTRETFRGELGLAYDLNETIEMSFEVSHIENLVFVESLQADQQRARVQGQWEKEDDRVRVYAEYRERQYDQDVEATGNGMRYSAEYNRRYGSYHWLRFRVFQDRIESEDNRRDYNRISGSIDYSRPIAKYLRLRTNLDVRSWKFPGRTAQGDPDGDRREDSYIAPEIGLDYGKSSGGLRGNVRLGYQLRNSNDERFTGDTPRFAIELGYRF